MSQRCPSASRIGRRTMREREDHRAAGNRAPRASRVSEKIAEFFTMRFIALRGEAPASRAHCVADDLPVI